MARPNSASKQNNMTEYEKKFAKAHRVMERYFDTDIQDADSAMDVFLDNGVDPEIAHEICDDMFPPTDSGE